MGVAIEGVRKSLNENYGLSIRKDWHLRCACHIVHRAVIDADKPLQPAISQLRSILKSIPLNQLYRELFRTAQMSIGKFVLKEVPNLDVDTRWTSNIYIATSCCAIRDVFESAWNDETADELLDNGKLTNRTWLELDAISNFLFLAAKVTELSSSVENWALSIQPLIHRRLTKHCKEAIENRSSLDVVRTVANLLKRKLANYQLHMTSPFLKCNVDFESKEKNNTESNEGFSMFASDGSGVASDEDDGLDQYFNATRKPDKSCKNFINWWKLEGRHKYPTIDRLARNSHMTMGPSAPSKYTFSDSGETERRSYRHSCNSSFME